MSLPDSVILSCLTNCKSADRFDDSQKKRDKYKEDFFDEHHGDQDDGQDFCPVDRWQRRFWRLELEQEHVGEQQKEEGVSDLKYISFISVCSSNRELKWPTYEVAVTFGP